MKGSWHLAQSHSLRPALTALAAANTALLAARPFRGGLERAWMCLSHADAETRRRRQARMVSCASSAPWQGLWWQPQVCTAPSSTMAILSPKVAQTQRARAREQVQDGRADSGEHTNQSAYVSCCLAVLTCSPAPAFAAEGKAIPEAVYFGKQARGTRARYSLRLLTVCPATAHRL